MESSADSQERQHPSGATSMYCYTYIYIYPTDHSVTDTTSSLFKDSCGQANQGIVLRFIHVGINPVQQSFIAVGKRPHGFHT